MVSPRPLPPSNGGHGRSPLVVLRLGVALASASQVTAKDIVKGISYGPTPCVEGMCVHQDDFMAPDAKTMWGSRYRGDLEVMKALGANTVRLYGNNPENLHGTFFDQVSMLGMKAVVGMSDWPYTQSPTNCMSTTAFDCYAQIKESYALNLQKGFLGVGTKRYHDGLAQVIVINEPDLKLPGITEPKSFVKGIISAVDGIVDAEREAGVVGRKVNLTVTFSFGICAACTKSTTEPGLGQMEELRMAFEDPLAYGYIAKNDLATVYRTRFINSFNTANPASDIRPLFLDAYEKQFPTVPVMIQEYHCPQKTVDLGEDLKAIVQIAEESPLLMGISYFEFQVRYDKGGSEMEFGMFGLRQNFSFGKFMYFGDEVEAWCLKPEPEVKTGVPQATSLAKAFGGVGLEYDRLCIPSPLKVPLRQEGLDAVRRFYPNDAREMASFLGRIVRHLGGAIPKEDDSGLVAFAQEYASPNSELNFTDALAAFSKHPTFAKFDAEAACYADREALASDVGFAIGEVCSKMTSWNCSAMPPECSGDVWRTADYAFSMAYAERPGDPMEACDFNGAAIFADQLTYGVFDSGCVVSKSPSFSSLTEPGYQLVRKNNAPEAVTFYIRRVVVALIGSDVTDDEGLKAFAEADLPDTLEELEASLKSQPWVCGINGHTQCPWTTTTTVMTATRRPVTRPMILVPTLPPPTIAPLGPVEGEGAGGVPTTGLGLGQIVGIVVGGVAIVGAAGAVAATTNARARKKKHEKGKETRPLKKQPGASSESDEESPVKEVWKPPPARPQPGVGVGVAPARGAVPSYGGAGSAFGGGPAPFGGGPAPFGSGSAPFGGGPAPFGGGPAPFGAGHSGR